MNEECIHVPDREGRATSGRSSTRQTRLVCGQSVHVNQSATTCSMLDKAFKICMITAKHYIHGLYREALFPLWLWWPCRPQATLYSYMGVIFRNHSWPLVNIARRSSLPTAKMVSIGDAMYQVCRYVLRTVLPCCSRSLRASPVDLRCVESRNAADANQAAHATYRLGQESRSNKCERERNRE